MTDLKPRPAFVLVDRVPDTPCTEENSITEQYRYTMLIIDSLLSRLEIIASIEYDLYILSNDGSSQHEDRDNIYALTKRSLSYKNTLQQLKAALELAIIGTPYRSSNRKLRIILRMFETKVNTVSDALDKHEEELSAYVSLYGKGDISKGVLTTM